MSEVAEEDESRSESIDDYLVVNPKKATYVSINEPGDQDEDDQDNESLKRNPMTESQGKAFKREEMMNRFTMIQDESEIPVTNEILDWRLFNVDFYSSDREYSEVEKVIEENLNKMIDIRPYIIDTPFLAQSTDRI